MRRVCTRSQKALTLVEVLVTLFVLLLIMSMAAMTYFATASALSTTTVSASVSAVVQAEQRFYVDYGQYTSWAGGSGTPSDLQGLLSNDYVITNGASTDPNTISLALSSTGTLGIAVLPSGAGSCLYATLSPFAVSGSQSNSGTVTSSTIPTVGGHTTACTGANALPVGSTITTPAIEKR